MLEWQAMILQHLLDLKVAADRCHYHQNNIEMKTWFGSVLDKALLVMQLEIECVYYQLSVFRNKRRTIFLARVHWLHSNERLITLSLMTTRVPWATSLTWAVVPNNKLSFDMCFDAEKDSQIVWYQLKINHMINYYLPYVEGNPCMSSKLIN